MIKNHHTTPSKIKPFLLNLNIKNKQLNKHHVINLLMAWLTSFDAGGDVQYAVNETSRQ